MVDDDYRELKVVLFAITLRIIAYSHNSHFVCVSAQNHINELGYTTNCLSRWDRVCIHFLPFIREMWKYKICTNNGWILPVGGNLDLALY